MKAIFNSTCIVTLATVKNILRSNDIDVFRHGVHTSSLFGNAFALMPVSLMVRENEFNRAARLLREASREMSLAELLPSCDTEQPSFFRP